MTAQALIYRCPHCNHPVDVDLQHENEVLVCPNENCQKPFKVDIPTAHPSAEMPFSPGIESLTHEAAAPAPAAVPVAAHPVTEVPEEVVQVVHLKMFRRYPFRCLAYVLLALAGVAGFIHFAIKDWWILALVCLGLGAAVVFRFVVWNLRMARTVFTITNKKCALEMGIFSKQLVELPLPDIQDIQVNQTFLNRLLNVGDLVLVSKKGEAQRLIVMAVPAPKETALKIRDLQPH